MVTNIYKTQTVWYDNWNLNRMLTLANKITWLNFKRNIKNWLIYCTIPLLNSPLYVVDILVWWASFNQIRQQWLLENHIHLLHRYWPRKGHKSMQHWQNTLGLNTIHENCIILNVKVFCCWPYTSTHV